MSADPEDPAPEDSYPRGPDGIDVHRVLEPVAELTQVASEYGWGAVLRIVASLVGGRGVYRPSGARAELSPDRRVLPDRRISPERRCSN